MQLDQFAAPQRAVSDLPALQRVQKTAHHPNFPTFGWQVRDISFDKQMVIKELLLDGVSHKLDLALRIQRHCDHAILCTNLLQMAASIHQEHVLT